MARSCCRNQRCSQELLQDAKRSSYMLCSCLPSALFSLSSRKQAMLLLKSWRFPLRSHRFSTIFAAKFRRFSTNAEQNALRQFRDKYLSGHQTEFTDTLTFLDPNNSKGIPIYRVLDFDGQLVSAKEQPTPFDDEQLVKIYQGMIKLNEVDKALFSLQRQGRVNFYIPHFGEEALQLASALALSNTDLVFNQYRELGVLLARDYPVSSVAAHALCSLNDDVKGRDAAPSLGSRDCHYVMTSAPLATQMAQSVGAAYHFKRTSGQRVVVCYFGDGASSEGDTHAALNFAATLQCPVLFFCKNNGIAVSTPSTEQYRGDGIAVRGSGYGMTAIRVDGNDALAVYKVVKEARKLALQNKPVLIEAMTYRVGNHSTADDSDTYRDASETKFWEKFDNPMTRLRNYLQSRNLWDQKIEETWRNCCKNEMLTAFSEEESSKKVSLDAIFTDVYEEMPQNLREQREELKKHLETYGDRYPLRDFEPFS